MTQTEALIQLAAGALANPENAGEYPVSAVIHSAKATLASLQREGAVKFDPETDADPQELQWEVERLRALAGDWRDLYYKADKRADAAQTQAAAAVRRADALVLEGIEADRAGEPAFAFTLLHPDGTRKAGALSEMLPEGGRFTITASNGTHLIIFRDGENS